MTKPNTGGWGKPPTVRGKAPRPTVRLRCYRCGKMLNRYVPVGAKDKSKAYCMEHA